MQTVVVGDAAFIPTSKDYEILYYLPSGWDTSKTV